MSMNDSQFNSACRTEFYETGKIPWPEWKTPSVHQLTYTDRLGWYRVCFGFSGTQFPLTDYEAACVNESARREWLETKGCHHSDVGHAHAWFIKPDALGCKEIARKRSRREALLAATRAVLALKGVET